jgi:hypothetical protein
MIKNSGFVRLKRLTDDIAQLKPSTTFAKIGAQTTLQSSSTGALRCPADATQKIKETEELLLLASIPKLNTQ